MSTFNGIFIRKTDQVSAELVREEFPVGDLESRGNIIGIALPASHSEAPVERLPQLSSATGSDVFWLSFQSAADSFEFHHWKAGRLLRSLVYGVDEERVWEKVAGNAEPWEAATFFHPRDLEWRLKHAETEHERQALEALFLAGRIEAGAEEPAPDSKDAAATIARHYEFPFLR